MQQDTASTAAVAAVEIVAAGFVVAFGVAKAAVVAAGSAVAAAELVLAVTAAREPTPVSEGPNPEALEWIVRGSDTVTRLRRVQRKEGAAAVAAEAVMAVVVGEQRG